VLSICKTFYPFHFSSSVLFFSFFSILLHFMFLFHRVYSTPDLNISLLSRVLSWSKRDHGCAVAQRRYDVPMYVRYIWQSLFASVISNCVVIREGRRMTHPIAWGNSDPYVSTRDFSGWGRQEDRPRETGGGATTHASAREEFSDHDPLRKEMCAEELGRMKYLASTDSYYKSDREILVVISR